MHGPSLSGAVLPVSRGADAAVLEIGLGFLLVTKRCGLGHHPITTHGDRVELHDARRTNMEPHTHVALEQITRWIETNRSALEAYWNGDIAFTEDLLERIKPLR